MVAACASGMSWGGEPMLDLLCLWHYPDALDCIGMVDMGLLEPAHRPESYTILSPITDAINVKIKNSRQKLAGSLNTRMPMSTVPMAPMPVHTG